MICFLKFVTSKLLNISDITKRIGNFFKLPIQLFGVISYPELAYIDISVGRIEPYNPDLTTQTINTHAHIRRMLRHHYPVILIQIEHSFLPAKFASKNDT